VGRQLAMPSKDRFRLHQLAHGWSRHQPRQGGQDRALGRRQLRPIDLPRRTCSSGQKQHLRLGFLEPKPNVSDVEHDAQPRIDEPVRPSSNRTDPRRADP
jgi:hypothetical protein